MNHPILKQKTSIDECIVSEIKISVTIGLGKSHGDYNKDKNTTKIVVVALARIEIITLPMLEMADMIVPDT